MLVRRGPRPSGGGPGVAPRHLSSPHSQMPLPKDVGFVTFDCYGTLIDWETGAYEAFQKEAERDGFTIDRDELIPLFIEIQREIRTAPTSSTPRCCGARRCARRRSWAGTSSPRAPASCPTACPRWPAFRETNAQLERFAKKFEIGMLSNIDDKLLGATRRHFRVDFDLVVTAQQVRSYKPDPAHFKECARRIGGKKRAGCTSRPATRPTSSRASSEGARDLGQPPRRASSSRARRSRPKRSRTSARRRSCSAPSEPCAARARGPITRMCSSSRAGCGRPTAHGAPARRRGDADRLAVLPGRARAAPGAARPGRVRGRTALLATHADWDHLLGRLAFPELRPGRGGADADAAARGAGRRPAGAARRRRRALRRAAPARSRSARPGAAGAGERRAGRGGARAPPGRRPHGGRHRRCSRAWPACCACGDYLSDVEIPMISAAARSPTTAPRSPGSRRSWRRRETVVPGHGSPHDRETALADAR